MPQGGRPGADQRIDEVFAVLVVVVLERRRLMTQRECDGVSVQEKRRVGCVQAEEPTDQFVARGGTLRPPYGDGHPFGPALVPWTGLVIPELRCSDQGCEGIALAHRPRCGWRPVGPIGVGPAGGTQFATERDACQTRGSGVGAVRADPTAPLPLGDLPLACSLTGWIGDHQGRIDKQQRRTGPSGAVDPIDRLLQATHPLGAEDPAGGIDGGDTALVSGTRGAPLTPRQVDTEEAGGHDQSCAAHTDTVGRSAAPTPAHRTSIHNKNALYAAMTVVQVADVTLA